MPYTKPDGTICKKCGESDKLFRNRWNKITEKWYLQSTCRDCELSTTKKHQQENRNYWRESGRKAYLKKVGELNRQSRTRINPEITKAKKKLTNKAWQLANPSKIKAIQLKQKLNGNDAAKSSRRRARLRSAFPNWDIELTDFVSKEACSLAKLRERYTNVKWHLDHIIPLKGTNVCGLHVWNNFQLLPASLNISKGNKFLIQEN